MLTKQSRQFERLAENQEKIKEIQKLREIKITFDDVKNYIHIFSKHYVDEIIDAVEPFAMDYIQSPYGYAETDKLNDIDECITQIEHMFWQFDVAETKRERNRMIKETIKTETERWKQRNAWAYGRYIGRLAYLINKQKVQRKDYWEVFIENLNK